MARPRDPELDVRILEAYRRLAEQVGMRNVSIAAVADEAGVSRGAVYRRWPSRARLQFEAQTSRSVDGGFADLGSVRADLVDMVERLVMSMETGDREVSGELMGQMVTSAEFSASVWEGRWGPDTDSMYTVWQRALDRGDVDDSVDGWAVMDELVAMAIYQVMLLHRPFGRAAIERFVDRILDGVTLSG